MQRALLAKNLQASASRPWRRFVGMFLAVFIVGSAALYAFSLAVDPYDSGRFPSLGLRGIVDDNPRTASVSRGRDPQFNAAVIGNSHGQLLSPARLDRATGLRFVQLTVPGTGPREQLAVMHWFVRHHARIGALVITGDRGWCTQDAALKLVNPFPFWLYDDSRPGYLANLFSIRSLDLAYRRIMLALGLRAPSDPSGYWDYEAGHAWTFHPLIPPETPPSPGSAPAEAQFAFPAIAWLADRLGRLPPATPVVLVMTPVFFTELPKPRSADAARLDKCKEALARLVADRPNGAFLDFMRDTPLARDAANFMDPAHYRAGVAMLMEGEIAKAMTGRPDRNTP